MTDYLAQLNPAQRRAVEFDLDRPLKVLAGPGTGKTKVLTSRYLFLLERDPSCWPENILTLTFTDKAAAEMKDRITRLCRETGVETGPLGLQEAWIGTFHSFCSRFLRQNALAAGIDPDFTVCDEAGSRLLYREAAKKYLAAWDKPPTFFGVTDFRFFEEEVYHLIGRLKDRFLYPEDFRQKAREAGKNYYQRLERFFSQLEGMDLHHATRKALANRAGVVEEQARWEEELITIISGLFSSYQEALTKGGYLDFADLIYYTYGLLSRDHPLQLETRACFSYILVDEFQDTNQAQFELLKLLARDEKMSNVTVVGDEKQAIYGWRNARLENLRDFAASRWGGEEVELTVNYRSYQGLLGLSAAHISRDSYFAGGKGVELEAFRGRSPGCCAQLYHASSQGEEAEVLALGVKGLLETGVPPGDIAFLLRSPRRSKPYEEALGELGIPYRTVGGVGFYQREEIKDLLAYLRVINNPYDDLALARALRAAPCFCTDGELYRLTRLRKASGDEKDNEVYLYDILEDVNSVVSSQPPGDGAGCLEDKVCRFLTLQESLSQLRDRLPLRDLIERVLDLTGYREYLYQGRPVEVGRRMVNIKKFLDLAEKMEGTAEPAVLDDFLAYTGFFLAGDIREGEGESKPEQDNGVTLMSVHQAKGLEFPHVFVANLTDTSFPLRPRYSPLDFDWEDGLIIKKDQVGNTFFKFEPYNFSKDNYRELYRAFGIDSHKERQRRQQEAEERRLFYVAITRAQDDLYLGCPAPFPDNPRGAHYFREIWEEFKGQDWLRTIACGKEETAAPRNGSPHDWTLADLNRFRQGVFEVLTLQPNLDGETVPPPEPVVISVTQMEAYRRCPRWYYLSYRLRLPPPGEGGRGEGNNYPLLLGHLIHQVLEAYHREGWSPKDASLLLEREAQFFPAGHRRQLVAAAQEMLDLYLSGPLARLEQGGALFEQEFNLILQGQGELVELKGKMDRIDRDSRGRWRIIDYKSNRVLTPFQREEYSRQLRLYAMAFQEIFPGRGQPALFIYHLPAGELIPVEWDPSHLEGARREVLALGGAIRRTLFPARQGKHCRWCQYGEYCRS